MTASRQFIESDTARIKSIADQLMMAVAKKDEDAIAAAMARLDSVVDSLHNEVKAYTESL